MSQRKQNKPRPQPARAARGVADEPSEEQVAKLMQMRGFFRDGGACGIDEVTGEIHAGRDFAELVTVLLRYAQRLDGAPERCRNPRCRKGVCHLALDEDDSAVCRGGIRPAALDSAALILGGLIEVGRHYVPEWFGEKAA